jgi:hypothetical protein
MDTVEKTHIKKVKTSEKTSEKASEKTSEKKRKEPEKMDEKKASEIDEIVSIKSKSSVSESEVTICSWYTYKHTRCSRKSNGSKFCDLHNTLKRDLRLLTKNESDEFSCATKKELKFVPRSRDHIIQVMKRLNYDQQFVDVCFPGGLIEEGTIEEDDCIKMPDDTKIYYSTTEKNKLKAKNIKVLFVNFCKEDPVISIRGGKEENGDDLEDTLYCKNCYKSVSKKIGYPKLSVIKE